MLQNLQAPVSNLIALHTRAFFQIAGTAKFMIEFQSLHISGYLTGRFLEAIPMVMLILTIQQSSVSSFLLKVIMFVVLALA